MQIELVGIVTLILGIATLWFGPGFGVAALATTSLLGAAAAVKLPVLGGSSITPGHLLLPFYIWVVGRACGGQLNLLRSFSFPSPAFWLAAFTVFAAISAVFLPRLFAGSVEVFGVARGPESQDRVIMLTLLRPTSGNITQSVYLVANAVLLAAAIAHVRYANGARAVVRAVYAVIGLNIAFGIADYVTYSQGMSEVMAPIRNANYAQLNEVELYGLKRIVGSFTEGSVYGAASLVCLAFSLELWMRGVRPGFFGITSLLSLFGLVSSFSSAALGAFGVYMILLWLRALVQLLIGRAGPSQLGAVLVPPLLMLIIAFALVLMPDVAATLEKFADRLFFEKLESESGVERSTWNIYALQAFYDTWLLGAGAGSIRSSSYAIGLLANVGLIGTALMLAYLAGLFGAVFRTEARGSAFAHVHAASWACVTMLGSAALAGATIDLGLLFFIMSGFILGHARVPGRDVAGAGAKAGMNTRLAAADGGRAGVRPVMATSTLERNRPA